MERMKEMELEIYLKTSLSEATVKRYLRAVEIFKTYFEKQQLDLDQVSYDEVMNYLGELRKKNKNISVPLSAIKKYFDFLIALEVRKDNPARAIKLRDKSSKDVQLQDLFTTAELELLMERKERYLLLKNRNLIIISLLIYQGLTTGEIKSLTLDHIDLEKGLIKILGSRKSNGRVLKLEPKQIFLLMNYIKEDRPNLLKTLTDKLIISKLGTAETGEGIGYLLESMRYLFPGRRLNAITIRQSVITNLLKKGRDLRVVQAFAGHKYPSTTEKYKQSDVEVLKAEVMKYHPLG